MTENLAIDELIASLVPVICPPDAVELELTDEIVAHLRLSMAAVSALTRNALRAGMVAYNQGARLWPPARGRRAHTLPPDRASLYFSTWWSSRIPVRKAFAMALKALICLACYETPAMKKEIGYLPEEWIARVKAARDKKFAKTIEAHQASLIVSDPLGPFLRHP